MKNIFLFLSVICIQVYAQANVDHVLANLDNAIENQGQYLQIKLHRIDSLTSQPEHDLSVESRFQINLTLFEEYSAFIYDSAFAYSLNLHQLATQLSSKEKLNIARVKMGFTFLSGGFFKEALDTLNAVEVSILNNNYTFEHYYFRARTYFELAEYIADDHFSKKYLQLGKNDLQVALKSAKPNSPPYTSIKGLLLIKNGQLEEAKNVYETYFDTFQNQLTDHQFAIDATTVSSVYMTLGMNNKAKEMLARAAIADLKTATKETVALRVLAEMFFAEGDIKRAYRYINQSLNDALYYEANHRKIQISHILPIIEKEQLELVRKQRMRLMVLVIVLAALSLAVIVLVFRAIKQNSEVRMARNQLQITNTELKQVNENLRDANKIKEEYVGYFFKSLSDSLERTNKLKKAIGRLLTTRNYSEIKETINNLDLKTEREQLLADFDKGFLSIFPNFVVEFNKLLKPEENIELPDNTELTPELRIVALIRLGIASNTKMSQILNYSMNTIYTYKTKIKNRATVSNDEFQARIMQIRVEG